MYYTVFLEQGRQAMAEVDALAEQDATGWEAREQAGRDQAGHRSLDIPDDCRMRGEVTELQTLTGERATALVAKSSA